MPVNDRNMVIHGVEELGGVFAMDMTDDVTHLIAVNPESSAKYQYAVDHPELGIKIVLPHWFQTCFNLRRRFPETIYLLPNPPLHNPDYVVSKTDIPLDSAPQLYANSLRPVISFLNGPSTVPSQSLVLQNKIVILAKDLFVLPDLRVSFVDKIQEAGGSILEDEGEYDRDVVDIVICRYRKGHLYKQASKDGKIVASIDWLLHTLQTGKLTSPMASLLHYPIPFRPIPGMSGKIITISNYNGPIREYIKRLIVTMGAVYKSTLTSPFAVDSTTHVICGDASGEKYEKGQEWNVKIVNHLWVEDCFSEWAIQSETKHKYVFLPPHSQLSFVFGAKLSPELIDEWVDVADGNESDARSDTSPKQTTKTEVGAESTKSDVPSSATDDKHTGGQDSGVHLGSNADKAEARVSARKVSKTDQDTDAEAGSPVETTAENASAPGAGAGGLRVVSRMRGAALEASKNLKKNVSDMNAFQQELRNEKRAPKKKRKMAENEGDTTRDESAEPEGPEQDTKSVTASGGEPLSPGKKRRTSTTPVVTLKGSKKNKSASVQAEETQDVEMGEEEQEVMLRASPKKGTQKESKDGASAAGSPRGPVRYITTSTVKIPAKLVKQLKALGVTEAKSVEQCTHLVANSIVRTEKFLYAIPACKDIVHEDWLQACVDANQIIDESGYPLKDAAGEKKYKIKLADAMKRARQGKVFAGCLFYFTPNTQPKMGVLKPLVEIGGGKTTALLQTGLSFIGEKIHKANGRAKRRDSKARKKNRQGGPGSSEEMVQSGEDEKGEGQSESESESEPSLSGDEQERTIIVISSKEDSDMWKPVLDAGASIYSTELVLTGLFRQELDLRATHKLA
ncbi:hypothetical protein BGZ73_001045 [Actinomortierella ambigua]|nr:hypothetical protein BGZ73_001045 [Actinomortierella ambigua]